MTLKKSTFQDLSTPITPETIVFPGDPVFECETITQFPANTFKLCKMHMSNHMGTHIDFPAHIVEKGKTSSDYTLDDLIGKGMIIEVPQTMNSITKSFVNQQKISANDFVFFKTKNSKLSKQSKLANNYVYIEPEAPQALLEKKVRIVGIDYISVDSSEAEALPVHQTLLKNDILIVENLELNKVDPGQCEIYIMPLNIPQMDGLPARVMMTR